MKNDKLFSEFENLAEKLGLKILKGRVILLVVLVL